MIFCPNFIFIDLNKNKILNILRKLGNVVDYMTEPMVARFFGVGDKCINSYSNRNGDELSRYGYKVLTGEELKMFREFRKLQD